MRNKWAEFENWQYIRGKQKMMRYFLIFFLVMSFWGNSQYNIERSYWKNNKTMPYENVIAFYDSVAQSHDEIQMLEIGTTDAGIPLYFVLINCDSLSVSSTDQVKLMINNGIHPGEPCGVDASIQWVYDFVTGKIQLSDRVAVGIIPLYNVGGAERRNSDTRANQNGPEKYGFRGNAQNLDLNRDFIKMDSKNAWSFANAFHFFDPDVLVDTHTSNGADYTYTMTYLPQMEAQLNPELRSVSRAMESHLFDFMEKKDYPMIPYVNSVKTTPYSGIKAYFDSPRYTTGYASLFNTIGFTSEAHMLKSFPERVKATYQLINGVVDFSSTHGLEIQNARDKALEFDKKLQLTQFNYELDTTQFTKINFKGYAVEYYQSELTGKTAYKYNSSQIVDTTIPYYSTYQTKDWLNIPVSFIIRRGNDEVVKRLKANDIHVNLVEEPFEKEVVRTITFPVKNKQVLYEGHFYHRELNSIRDTSIITINKNDYLVEVTPENKRFLAHVLIPEQVDSYWRWNFFDSYLQQKEYFSAYVFEETAKKLVESDPDVRKKWETYKSSIDLEKTSHWEMLYFLYKLSDNYEGTAFEYPVYMVY